MRHASLFSGIGGFDLAAQWMGWENVFQVEQDEFCQRVLAHHFPETRIYGDIKEFSGLPYRGQIDIITGGFPCQPYSMAGKRLGKDDERHLWPEMLRVIREVAPAYVVGENVRGLLSWSAGLVFEEVCADLEAAGYEVWTGILPAASVGAPHRRDRVWFVAYSHANDAGRAPGRHAGKDGGSGLQERDEVEQPCKSSCARVWHVADARSQPPQNRAQERDTKDSAEKRPRLDNWTERPSNTGDAANPASNRRLWQWQATETEKRREQGRGESGQLPGGLKRFCLVGDVADTRHSARSCSESNERGNEGQNHVQQKNWQKDTGSIVEHSQLAADTQSPGRRFCFAPNIRKATGKKYAFGHKTEIRAQQFCNWHRHWDEFPTQSPVCGRDDGFPGRLDGISFPKWREQAIKGFGNAIVPQVALQIFRAIEETQSKHITQ